MDILEIYVVTNKEIPDRNFIVRQYYDIKDEKYHHILYVWEKDFHQMYHYLHEGCFYPKIKHVINTKRFRHCFDDKEIPKLTGYNVLGN
jgi:hypothetical protein